MKWLVTLLALIVGSSGWAAASKTKGLSNDRLDAFDQRIYGDVKSGKLLKSDADRFQRELNRVQRMEKNSGHGVAATSRTRSTVGQKLNAIETEITRKEKQAQAIADAAAASKAKQPVPVVFVSAKNSPRFTRLAQRLLNQECELGRDLIHKQTLRSFRSSRPISNDGAFSCPDCRCFTFETSPLQ